jgi:hypothetical protein
MLQATGHKRVTHRVAGGGHPPQAPHTTVRTVPYTAVPVTLRSSTLMPAVLCTVLTGLVIKSVVILDDRNAFSENDIKNSWTEILAYVRMRACLSRIKGKHHGKEKTAYPKRSCAF